MLNIRIGGVLILLSMSLLSCSNEAKIERKKLEIRNPTSKIFDFNVKSLKDTLNDLFSVEKQAEDDTLKSVFYFTVNFTSNAESKMQVLFTPEFSASSILGKNHFKKPNTSNDVYLHSYGQSWTSQVYFLEDKPLQYQSSFILKLKKVDERHTELSVQAENPIVIYSEGLIAQSSLNRREVKVGATSIEEYCLIRYIANQLGDTSATN